MELQTTTGEGWAIVTVEYTADENSDDFQSWVEIEIEKVMFEGVNIFPAISVEQYEELKVECQKAADADAADSKADAAIDRAFLEQ